MRVHENCGWIDKPEHILHELGRTITADDLDLQYIAANIRAQLDRLRLANYDAYVGIDDTGSFLLTKRSSSQSARGLLGFNQSTSRSAASEIATYELSDYLIDNPSVQECKLLFDVINQRQDENAFHSVLKSCPSLLSRTWLAGHGTYAISKPRLGAEYVPDFLIAGCNSMGLNWEIVELEAPTDQAFTAGGRPSLALREAIHQIHDWRAWIQSNEDYVTRPKAEHGLGLYGLTRDVPAVIYISTDFSSHRASQSEILRLREREQIYVRTTLSLLATAIDRCPQKISGERLRECRSATSDNLSFIGRIIESLLDLI